MRDEDGRGAAEEPYVADPGRMQAQAIEVSRLLSEAGIGAMPIPEGVKTLTEQRDEARRDAENETAHREACHEEYVRACAERDEARAFGEDAAAKYNALLAKYNALLDAVRTVTCAFCGDQFPRGTPRHGDGALAEHIKACPAHPMRAVEAERDRLLAYLHATTDEDGTHHRDWVADCQLLERALAAEREGAARDAQEDRAERLRGERDAARAAHTASVRDQNARLEETERSLYLKLNEAERERDEAVALLKECEWVLTPAYVNQEGNIAACPVCKQARTHGHDHGCRLDAFLAGGRT